MTNIELLGAVGIMLLPFAGWKLLPELPKPSRKLPDDLGRLLKWNFQFYREAAEAAVLTTGLLWVIAAVAFLVITTPPISMAAFRFAIVSVLFLCLGIEGGAIYMCDKCLRVAKLYELVE